MPGGNTEAVRIGHFSDLHLPLTQAIPLGSLIGKRLLGYANLAVRRGKTHKLEACETLLRRLADERPDLVVMTGDWTNLSLASEFSRVDGLFQKAGLAPEKMLAVPGNHDRYTFGADHGCAFERGASRWLPPGFSRRGGYPIVKAVGPVVLIGLDTAVWRSAARDAGRIDPDQLARLIDTIRSEAFCGHWPVVVLHHPPFRRQEAFYKDYLSGLEGADTLIRALEGRGATVLHGHVHRLLRRRIGKIDVIGVASASNDAGDPSRQLAYHLYTFTASGLKEAEIVRFWPDKDSRDWRVERARLPEEAD